MRIDLYAHSELETAILASLGKLNRKVDKMSQASQDLAREVQETKAAVTALTGRYQVKIDQMQGMIDDLNVALAAGDTAAAQQAASDLNDLQTEMNAIAPASASPVPAQEPPVNEALAPVVSEEPVPSAGEAPAEEQPPE